MDQWFKVCQKRLHSKTFKQGAHKKANELEHKIQLGAMGFKEKVVKDTPIGRGLTKMWEKDLETLRICFNSAYYLVKQEHPFCDYPNLVTLQHENGIKKFQSYVADRAAVDFTDWNSRSKKI